MDRVRQHCGERREVIVTAWVRATPEGQFSVRLSSSNHGTRVVFEDTTRYLSQVAAEVGADNHVRLRHAHRCGQNCSGWQEDA
jgi:hypothetical protein